MLINYDGSRMMIQVTSDGEMILCQCGDKIQVIDTKSGKVAKSLKQEEDEIITFQLSPNDSVVVSSHKSGLLRHWSLKGSLSLSHQQ